MITISPEAVAYIQAKSQPVYLDLPPLIDCCIPLRECPSVRFGTPHDPQNYHPKMIGGIRFALPKDLPEIPLEIVLTRTFGFKRLVVEGWQLA